MMMELKVHDNGEGLSVSRWIHESKRKQKAKFEGVDSSKFKFLSFHKTGHFKKDYCMRGGKWLCSIRGNLQL